MMWFRKGNVTAYAIVLPGLIFSAHAFASPSCDQVNNGIWNVSLQSFAIGATLNNFDAGDKITFHATHDGQLILLGSYGQAFISKLVVNTPHTGSYTVSNSNEALRILNDAVAGPLTVHATCVAAPVPVPPPIPTPTPAPVKQPTTLSSLAYGLSKTFLLSRMNSLLLSDPMGVHLSQRDNDVFTDSASELTDHLSQLRLKIAKPIEIWVDGNYNNFRDNTSSVVLNGHAYLFYMGGDYRLTQNTMIGVLAEYDNATENVNDISSDINGKGWLAGPYFSTHFYKNLFLDMRAAWGRSYNHLSIGAASGSFNTLRWLTAVTLSGDITKGQWLVTPAAKLEYMMEKQPAFITSSGTDVGQHNIPLGQLQLGPEISYQFNEHHNYQFAPFVSLYGVWAFNHSNASLLTNTITGPGEVWGRAQGGVNVRLFHDVSLRGLISLDDISSTGYSAYSAELGVSVLL